MASLSKEQDGNGTVAADGKLRLLCATSSMELGIDVGKWTRYWQVGCPRTVSGTMQRLGPCRTQSGPGERNVFIPRTAAECVSCGMTRSWPGKAGGTF